MRAGRTVATIFALGMAAPLIGGGLAQANGEMDIIIVERATTDTVIDVGEPGDTIGDMLAFGNDLYDADNVTLVGRDQGQCFRSNPGMSWECIWTNILEEGSITVQGPFYDDLRDVALAITGGTGNYKGATGTMTLHARDAAGTELEFAFHLQVDDDQSPESGMDDDAGGDDA